VKNPTASSRLSTLAWVVPLALLAMAVRLTAGPHPVDDAYITFRYALNLLDGRGLVYNPGEVVLGTSAPLYAILLAAVAKLTGTRAMPVLAMDINALADGFSAAFVFLILRRLRVPPRPAALSGFLMAISPFVIRYSIGGMETSLLTAVLLLASLLSLQGRYWVPYHLSALAAGLRPDALAFAAALLIGEAWRTKRLPWRAAAVVGAWIGAGMLVLFLSYGDPLPQSVLAKAHEVYRVQPGTNFFQHVLLFSGLTLTGARGFGARGLAVSPTPALAALALLTLLPLAALWGIGAARMAREEPETTAIPLYVLIFTGVYSLLGLRGALMAEWYLVPLVPFWLIPLFFGLAFAGQRIQRASARTLVWALPLTLALLAAVSLNWNRDSQRPPTLPLNVWDEREQAYLQAADFLRGRRVGGSVVAASEIGALGYGCECRIFDTVGLVSPAASAYYPLSDENLVGNYAVPTRLILELQPEYLVSLEVFLRNTLMKDQEFLSQYRLVWQASSNAFGSRGLLIFQKAATDPDP